MSTPWDEWEQLRSADDPDPIEMLRAVSTFQRYFSAIEATAVRLARAKGSTWEEIGTAVGRSKQALWQRVASPRTLSPRALEEAQREWEAIKRDPDSWWAKTKRLHL